MNNFKKDVEAIKTPGRFKMKYKVETVTDDDDEGEETVVFERLDPFEQEPSADAGASPELIPVWGELMACNWGKLRRNIILLGKKVYNSNFETVEKEFRSLSRQLAFLDTRIGKNPTMLGVVSVWEAIEDILAERKEFEKLLESLKMKQNHTEDKQKEDEASRKTDRDNLDTLCLNFESLADSYTISMPAIKAKLAALEGGAKGKDPR